MKRAAPWIAVYRRLLVLLPAALRDMHGAATAPLRTLGVAFGMSTLALTLPMAVRLTVLLASSGRGTALDAAPMTPAPRRRPLGLVPVLAAASVIAALTLVASTQVVPRANDRPATVLAGHAVAASERSMTVSALRDAARATRIANSPDASRAARPSRWRSARSSRSRMRASCPPRSACGARTCCCWWWRCSSAGGGDRARHRRSVDTSSPCVRVHAAHARLRGRVRQLMP